MSTVAFLIFILAYLRSKKQLFADAIMGITTAILIFFIGLLSAHLSIPANQPDHYLNKDIAFREEVLAKAIVTEELKPTSFSKRYLVKLEELISAKSSEPVQGKVLLNIPQDSTFLEMGNKILIPWMPEELKESLNPFQFDYRKYMQRLAVERQISISKEQLRIIGYRESLTAIAWNFREQLITKLEKHNFGKDELAIFQAMILGQRREITDQLYKNYAAAGAIHILAISGLHVGILLIFLNYILNPLERLKKGKYIKPLLVISLLWSFAFLTGLSPSVVRAVFMFSFLAIGIHMKRKTSTFNSLFVSLFFLLLINPRFLFQAGFQLSYLAVFSIIIFQPFIYQWFSIKIKVIDYFWKIISVSLAAQIGVLPLSIYYFHQFPGMFLASNLIILPILGFILGLGIIIILLAYIGTLPRIFAEGFSKILEFLNLFIQNIANMDSLVFTGIDISLLQCITLYLGLIGVLLMLRKPNFWSLSFVLCSVLLFQWGSFYRKITIPEQEVVVFHKTRETLIGKKHRKELFLFNNSGTIPVFITDYIRERGIKHSKQEPLPRIFSVSNELFLIVDTVANYNLENFNPDFILLRNSPKLNIERLIEELQPRKVIADGSNYRSYITRWRNTCKAKKIPFHYTGEKGAFIFKGFEN